MNGRKFCDWLIALPLIPLGLWRFLHGRWSGTIFLPIIIAAQFLQEYSKVPHAYYGAWALKLCWLLFCVYDLHAALKNPSLPHRRIGQLIGALAFWFLGVVFAWTITGLFLIVSRAIQLGLR